MDELLVFGCIVLFLALVVVPILAIVAINRTASLRDELARLRLRLEALEAREVQSEPAVAAPAPEVTKVEPPPLAAPVQQPLAVDNGWRPRPAKTKTARKPAATSEPSAFGGVISSLVRWFMQGNPLAKLGILLLFLGLSFLLRYSVEHALLPLELRLAAAGIAAIVLLAVGWRLRHRQRVYALILQGGATGVLYLTVFGAFRLWQMLPPGLAFALLVAICAASVGLAVLQKALSLAMLASLGGYLAPLLLATGGGSHVALFSFYLLLSVGILAVSARQHWRELNLLGLLFTFGVGALWGLDDYRPEYYLSCQLFLVANIILFGVLSVALSLRAQEKGRRIVDGVLLFAPPLAGFAMQYAITRDMPWGPALSALGYGAFYIALAWLALRRFPSLGRTAMLASLALGGAFTTLAIPLALSARWTAMAWAVEGLGVLWLGVQQQQRRMRYSGTALLLLAVAGGGWAYSDAADPLTQLMVSAVLSLCWLAAGRLWRGDALPLSLPLLCGGIVFWLAALHGAALLLAGDNRHTPFVVLGLLALSAWSWRYAARRLAWPEVGHAAWLLWPAMALVLLMQIADGRLFAAGLDNLAWCAALPSALLLLRRESGGLARWAEQGLHLTLFWLILLALGAELWWFVAALPWGMEAWRSGLVMAAGAAAIGATSLFCARGLWPFSRWPALYNAIGVAPVVPVLALMLLFANLEEGATAGWGYLPLVNPLEEGAGFALLALWYFFGRALPRVGLRLRPWRPLALGGVLFWWLNGMLMRALAWYGDIVWSAQALWHSRLVQTSFALFWMLAALALMLRATKAASRRQWFAGAALLGAVIVKLMLVDSAGGGGLARAVAFIGVAVLVLIIGYFSPLPPKEAPAAQPGEEK
ncbi:DUF2339 domain-containing protein [Pluralibacter gergoviae]|uniref:DUF2339 domain-containing protein n=1 Tax=Pluralibacter gergoviae TaxID=61647 RepID=UPI000650FAEC|nr:DUF2339 domain-containing protein [Pluralibacter gergoviae]EKV0930103.1 DUF2339 domain-containing protein [Pluralibacter gergoviae]EKV6247382.1 DUF2339 domain-containing protein [Pluralibacter gergoviae]ELD4271866.1 DUF2339 domain-containing protein [Pluralibacter gergoviae]ELD4277621.1 DUF2339 domain-containing protein [Pluralibacter gergoviae]ELD4301699.1 DUF2339 domain-containing protein [Pluralibacter gergoviae]